MTEAEMVTEATERLRNWAKQNKPFWEHQLDWERPELDSIEHFDGYEDLLFSPRDGTDGLHVLLTISVWPAAYIIFIVATEYFQGNDTAAYPIYMKGG